MNTIVNVAGDEVAHVYLRDDFASGSQPLKQLKKFTRFHLKAGATREVKFTLGADDLSLVGMDGKWTVEPGRFLLMVGASSEDIRLNKEIIVE